MTERDRLSLMAAILAAGYRILGARDHSVESIVAEARELDRGVERELDEGLPRHGDTVEAAHAPR